jgi:endonuclease/exonuclease/phosphatase family metal-dependent hydrolase
MDFFARDKHSFYVPYEGKDRSGLAILSRYPLPEPAAHFFPESKNGLGYVMSEVIVGGNPILLVNLHLDRNERVRARKAMPRVPWRTAFGVIREELFEETTRYRQVGMILDRLDSDLRQTTIMAGDFNTIPYGTAVRKAQTRFDDALWPSLAYFSNTFREIGFPLKPRIDYIFHSPEIHRTKSGVIRSGPGDHYPVWAEFRIREIHGVR